MFRFKHSLVRFAGCIATTKQLLFCCSLLFSTWGTAAPFKVYTSDYPPYSFVEDGVQKGMAIDLLKEVFVRMNVPLSIEFVPFTRAVKLFERGEVDGIFPFSRRDDRLRYTLFPKEPLITDSHVLYVRADSNIQFNGNLAELEGYSFGRQRDAFNGQVFAGAVEKGIIRNLHEAKDQRHVVLMLVASRFDIAVGPSKVVQYFAKETGNLKNIKELKPALGNPLPAFLGFSKHREHTELSVRFDRTLLNMRRDGSYQRIIDPYLK